MRSDNDQPDSGIIRPATPGFGPSLGPVAPRPPGVSAPPPLPIRKGPPPLTATPSISETANADYTAGWLVIVAGPGKGKSLFLGSGMNQLGRAAANRVVLDFGDAEIADKEHATITYDPRGRKFYIQPGTDPRELTYLGSENTATPVLIPTELAGNETISLGGTQLKFVPFCGPAFSWI